MDSLEQAYIWDDIESAISEYFPSDASSSLRSSRSNVDSLDFSVLESLDESEVQTENLQVLEPKKASGKEPKAEAETKVIDQRSQPKGNSLLFITAAALLTVGFLAGAYFRKSRA